MVRPTLAILLLLLLALPAAGQPPAFPPPKTLGPVESYGRHIQRAMARLAGSTPQRRQTVRVLFYGQSITEQETVVTLAQGLSHGRHTVEITGGPETPIAALRVYRPPMGEVAP